VPGKYLRDENKRSCTINENNIYEKFKYFLLLHNLFENLCNNMIEN